MRHTILAAHLAVALFVMTGPHPALAEQIVAGHDRLTVPAAHRAGSLAGSLWYPAGPATKATTEPGLIGDDAVFVGSPALGRAPVAEGRHPLVLLSHGSGGNMDGLAWLSSALALEGAMVLAVNHPGSTSGDSSALGSVNLQDRAADLSAALDHVLADPALAAHVEPGRIAALGFSMGGATALHLAGGRMDRALYRDYCARLGPEAIDCLWWARGGVDLAALPPAWEGDMRDPRVSASIAVDPGYTHALTQASIAAMRDPVLLINLGAAGHRWPAVDVGPAGSDLAARLPDATYVEIDPAHHFTFLAECKPGAAAILDAAGEEPVCDDPPGADRADVHREIIARVGEFLDL